MIDPEEMEVAELFQEIRRIAAAHIHSSAARSRFFDLLDSLDQRIEVEEDPDELDELDELDDDDDDAEGL